MNAPMTYTPQNVGPKFIPLASPFLLVLLAAPELVAVDPEAVLLAADEAAATTLEHVLATAAGLTI